MAAPIVAAGIYTIARYTVKHGAQKAIKKFGQKNFDKLLNSKSMKKAGYKPPVDPIDNVNKGLKAGLITLVGAAAPTAGFVAHRIHKDEMKRIKSKAERKASGTKHLGTKQKKQYGGPVRKAKY